MSEYRKEIEWRVVPSFPQYEVNNIGEIRNLNGKLRCPSDNGAGYTRITVKDNKKWRTLYIHRAVLEAFNPILNSSNFDINHKDFNRSNNKLENLEWLSHKENMNVSFSSGQFKKRDKKRSEKFKKLGDTGKHCWSKLNKEKILEIYKLWQTGGFNYSQLGKKYGVTGVAIKYAIKRLENGRYD